MFLGQRRIGQGMAQTYSAYVCCSPFCVWDDSDPGPLVSLSHVRRAPLESRSGDDACRLLRRERRWSVAWAPLACRRPPLRGCSVIGLVPHGRRSGVAGNKPWCESGRTVSHSGANINRSGVTRPHVICTGIGRRSAFGIRGPISDRGDVRMSLAIAPLSCTSSSFSDRCAAPVSMIP